MIFVYNVGNKISLSLSLEMTKKSNLSYFLIEKSTDFKRYDSIKKMRF